MQSIRAFSLLAVLVAVSSVGGETLYVAPDVYNRVEIERVAPAAADQRFAEARQAAEDGELSRALRLAGETLHLDPDHTAARRVLGYQQAGDAWVTPYQAKQQSRGYQWDARFGWVTPDELPRWEAGERPTGRRWASVESDRERHADIKDGWRVRTDHFVVITNHSREAGAALAAELENLYQVWRQRFAGYWLEEREVAQLFAGERNARKSSRRFEVVYHRDKAGYVEHLRRREPRIAQTLGIYFDTLREAHFFHSDDPVDAARLRPTLYHEAVHQLFQESAPKARSPGENANYWVIEGVACWFETLRPVGSGRYAIGRGGRLRSAMRITRPAPVADLVALGQSDLQRQPDLAAIYAQSTALVAMLAETQPEALVQYLRSVYYQRPGPDALLRATGKSAADLDAAYRRFASERLAELAEPAGGQ